MGIRLTKRSWPTRASVRFAVVRGPLSHQGRAGRREPPKLTFSCRPWTQRERRWWLAVRLCPADWSERVQLGITSRPVPRRARGGCAAAGPGGPLSSFRVPGPWSGRSREWTWSSPAARAERRSAPEPPNQRTATWCRSACTPSGARMPTTQAEGRRPAAEGVGLAAVTDHNVIGDLGAEWTLWRAPKSPRGPPRSATSTPSHCATLPNYRRARHSERLFRELHRDPGRVRADQPSAPGGSHLLFRTRWLRTAAPFSTAGASAPTADGLEVYNGYHIGQSRTRYAAWPLATIDAGWPRGTTHGHRRQRQPQRTQASTRLPTNLRARKGPAQSWRWHRTEELRS